MNGDRAEKPVPPRTGLRRLGWALRYSLRGIGAALRLEPAFRQECVLALVLVPLALWLPAEPWEKALLTGSVLLVLIVELLNSALEAVVDRYSSDFHVLAGRAKDLASAAVFLCLVNCAAVWALVLWGAPRPGSAVGCAARSRGSTIADVRPPGDPGVLLRRPALHAQHEPEAGMRKGSLP